MNLSALQCIVLAVVCCVVPDAVAQSTLIHAGTVMTEAGAPLLEEHTIVISGGRIEDIQPGYLAGDLPGLEGASIVDLRDYFVMPGFIDTHVHLTTSPDAHEAPAAAISDTDLVIRAAVNARRVLHAGFTTVMDLGTSTRDHEKAIYALRRAIGDGIMPGPEILAAGSPISALGYSRTGQVNDSLDPLLGAEGTCFSPDSCRQQVLEQVRRGADFINVYSTGSLLQADSPAQTLSDPELAAVADTAASLGLPVIADGGNSPAGAEGINNAIKAGFGIIDTVTYPDEQTFSLLIEHGGFFAPHVHALNAAVGDTPESLEKGSMGSLPRPMLEFLYQLKQETPSALAGYRAGAVLLLASDSGVFPHGDNARELLAYVDLGIPAVDALAAATSNAARAFGLFHRTGSIAPGKEADVVAFGRNPLESIETVLTPLFIMSDGVIHQHLPVEAP